MIESLIIDDFLANKLAMLDTINFIKDARVKVAVIEKSF